MTKILNTFAIGFSKECSFPEVIQKLENDNIIKISQWVTTGDLATIDLFDFYHGKYFSQREITHKIDAKLYDKIAKYMFEFCYINSRNNLSHKYIKKIHTTIFDEVHEFNKFVYVIYDIFISQKIDLVLFQEIPHDGAEIILYRLAKVMGIKTIILANFTHFWGRIFAFYSLEDFGNFNEIPELSSNTEAVDVEYKDFKSKMYYMNNVVGYLKKIDALKKEYKKHKRKFFLKSLFSSFVSKDNIQKTEFALCTSLMQYSRALEYHANMTNAVDNSIDLNKKYVYFAMHLDPEIPTTPALAGVFCDQLIAIERLSAILPNDMFIYVKENPKQTDILRPKAFFERLAKLKNVKLVNRNTYELIDNSCFVATIAGTVGWEAITGGKNVLAFGKNWYQTFPGVFKFDENLNLDEIINYKIDKSEFEKKLQAIVRKSGNGMIYFPFSNPEYTTKITDIYPKYERENNINDLYKSIKKLIEYKHD